MDVDRHTHPCQDVLAGTGIHSDKAESCIKMLKVEAVYLRGTTKPSRMSLPIFLAALKTSTTRGGSAPRSPPEPSAVRGSRRLADGQNRRVILL
jgi:hypothetical protein